jgi:hypothetical protein
MGSGFRDGSMLIGGKPTRWTILIRFVGSMLNQVSVWLWSRGVVYTSAARVPGRAVVLSRIAPVQNISRARNSSIDRLTAICVLGTRPWLAVGLKRFVDYKEPNVWIQTFFLDGAACRTGAECPI